MRQTRAVEIGSVTIGAGHPIAVQSMCATKTTDVEATVAQVVALQAAGAAVIRIAVDTPHEADALRQIRERTDANLSVDLQENYRLVLDVAPLVEKVRYNPGHLYHFEPERPWQDKVRLLVDTAGECDCAMRIGVNCGSVDPAKREKYPRQEHVAPMLDSALEHCELLDQLGFTRYCVSLKDSDPARVVEASRRFAAERPDVPLHLGVTEAGLPPQGIIKTRIALEPLIRDGIGDTIRVSLTVPFEQKPMEVHAGRQILEDVAAGRFLSADQQRLDRLSIISCPSCSRVQNEAFIELAEQVRDATREWVDCPLTIAVMGCRVNGPGETDDADLGLWCGTSRVNLKRRGEVVGSYGFDEIVPKVRQELAAMAEQLKKEGPTD